MNVSFRFLRFVIALVFAGAAFAGMAKAQEAYPSRPVKIVVSYGPGGANDLIGRLIAKRLSQEMGGSFYVENKIGAGGLVGASYAAKSKADGYTLFVGTSGTMAVNAAIYRKLPYDPVRDFEPIASVASFPVLLVVNAGGPIKTVPDLVAWQRANPAKSNYAGGAAGFQLATELFKRQAKVPMEYVPYKSSAEVVRAVLSNEVLAALVDVGPAFAMVNAGQLRPLAVTSKKRLPNLPDVPTFTELGVDGVNIDFWTSVFVPAGTPPDIVAKLQAAVMKFADSADFKAELATLGLTPDRNDAAQVKKMLVDETAKWVAIAKAANIYAD